MPIRSVVFNRTLQGITEGAGDTNVADISRGLPMDGAQARLALAALSPAELLTEPLYNPTGGYASYVVPAAFVLIIQQTLLMGTATLTALGFESRRGVRRITPGATGLIGRGLAHLTIYASALALFFVVLPRIYGFSTLGRVADLALFAVPFVLATRFMGQVDGSFFKHRETAVLVFVATTCRNSFSSAFLAARDDSATARAAAPHLSERVGDRWFGAHWANGHSARGGAGRLALPVAPHCGLLRARGGSVASTSGD
jgi:hypothetical protein